MSEQSEPDRESIAREGAEGVGDALRAAVERTLAATAGPASETRARAQELLDEVVRRGQAAREDLTRRGEEASARLADAITELRAADRDDLGLLSERIAALEGRLGSLERLFKGQSNPKVEDETPAGGGDSGA